MSTYVRVAYTYVSLLLIVWASAVAVLQGKIKGFGAPPPAEPHLYNKICHRWEPVLTPRPSRSETARL